VNLIADVMDFESMLH